MPSITPSQRVFGIGMTPIERAFRPPEGMEYDPAYNDFARQKWARADMEDAQREAVRAQRDEAVARREQLAAERNTRQAEDAAIEAIQQNPDQIPNILKSFPELARSRNLGGVLHYAQAVTPSAGQRTLAPSLRNKLKPHERQYFDEHFNQNGNALSAYDAAQMRGEHENGLVEMMKAGVPLDVVDKYRERPLNPLEREAIVQQHAMAKGGKNTSPLKEAYDLDLKLLYEDPKFLELPPSEKAKQVRQMRLAYELDKAEAQQTPPAVATPAAEGGKVAPVQGAAVPAAAPVNTPLQQQLDLSKVPFDQVESTIKQTEEKAKEAETINKAWYDAQMNLQKKLEKEFQGNYPGTNYSKLRRFAEAVVNNETTQTPKEIQDKFGTLPQVGRITLLKLGINPFDNAFEEPGNKRIGTQKVPYEQVLKSWAENYLGTSPVTVAPQVPALPAKKANVLDSLLESSIKPSNS